MEINKETLPALHVLDQIMQDPKFVSLVLTNVDSPSVIDDAMLQLHKNHHLIADHVLSDISKTHWSMNRTGDVDEIVANKMKFSEKVQAFENDPDFKILSAATKELQDIFFDLQPELKNENTIIQSFTNTIEDFQRTLKFDNSLNLATKLEIAESNLNVLEDVDTKNMIVTAVADKISDFKQRRDAVPENIVEQVEQSMNQLTGSRMKFEELFGDNVSTDDLFTILERSTKEINAIASATLQEEKHISTAVQRAEEQLKNAVLENPGVATAEPVSSIEVERDKTIKKESPK